MRGTAIDCTNTIEQFMGVCHPLFQVCLSCFLSGVLGLCCGGRDAQGSTCELTVSNTKCHDVCIELSLFKPDATK